MTAPQSTPLPPAPQRNEPESQFVAKSNTFVAALEPHRQELQAQADFVNDVISGRYIVETVAGAGYSITSADENKVLLFTSASAVTVTLPSDATDNLAVGSVIQMRQDGDGVVSIGIEAGVTLSTPESNQTRKKGSTIAAIKTGADAWGLMGDLGVEA